MNASLSAHETPGKSSSLTFVDSYPRLALGVFLLLCLVSFWLAINGGGFQSFFYDDWDFLAGRDAGNLGSLLRPHNEHWTTIPILAYRTMWSLVGISSYVPYQLMSISLHLMVAGLLRALMRRSDVAPWIATAAAGLFALYGSGAHNIYYAFQITYVGALAFGLAQLLLADHEGPVGWRDCMAVVVGLASLMCCNHGVPMVFIVGVAVLLKHGWRKAMLQTAPLALIFLAWWFIYGQNGMEPYYATPSQITAFVISGVVGTFIAIGQLPGLGLLLAIMIIPGIVVTWQSSGWIGLRARFGTPVALALGSLVFLAITGYGRAFFGAESARASRYLDLVAAMWLPLIAVATTVISRSWKVTGVFVMVVFLIGTIGNTKLLWEYQQTAINNHFFLNEVRTLAHSDLLASVPDDVRPFPEYAREVTTGWLAEGARSGRIPKPESVGEETFNSLKFRMSFAQGRQKELGESCEVLTAPIDLDLDVGNRLIVKTLRMRIVDREAENPATRTIDFLVHFKERFGNGIDVLAPVKVRLSGGTPDPVEFAICR